MTQKQISESKTKTGAIFAAIAVAPCGPQIHAGRNGFIPLLPQSLQTCPAHLKSCTSCWILPLLGLKFHRVRGIDISSDTPMKVFWPGINDMVCMRRRKAAMSCPGIYLVPMFVLAGLVACGGGEQLSNPVGLESRQVPLSEEQNQSLQQT